MDESQDIFLRYIQIDSETNKEAFNKMVDSPDIQRAMYVLRSQFTPELATMIALLCYHAGTMNAYDDIATRSMTPHKHRAPLQ